MSNSQEVVSPIPGMFYRKPAPDKEVYVNEGDQVEKGDVIGLVEVMKNYYEVKAEISGVVESFKVDDEEMLEAGQNIALIVNK